MANAITKLTIIHGTKSESPAAIQAALAQPTIDAKTFGRRLVSIIVALVGGTAYGRVTVEVENASNLTVASLAGTFTNAPAGDGTITIGGVVLTAKASPANENEFAAGSDAATAATGLAAAINAHSALVGLVTASAAAGVVTIASAVPGRIGNLITVIDNLSNFTLAGSATKLSGATSVQQVAARTFDFGGVA